jgi:hypothetical protein
VSSAKTETIVSRKTDPNVLIPTAVRRQAEAADAAFKAMKGELPTPTPESPPSDNASVANDNAPAPTEPVTPEVTPAPESDPAPTPDVNWEHRYKSMEGRYKRAEQDIRALSDQIASMQSLIGTLQARATVEPTPQELRAESLLTPEEVNEYGAEFLGVVAKKAKEELSPEVAALKKQIAMLEQRLEGTVTSNTARARRDLESTLDREVPSWREINVAPEFHSWLALPDVFSGAIRHELLTAAYEQNNTPRVLAFFRGFLAEEAALAPAPKGEPAPVGATPDKIPLETLAAPGRAKTAAAPGAPAEKPTFTRAQISQFYADSAAGKYRGREAEKNRIEAQIFEAEREGRIR